MDFILDVIIVAKRNTTNEIQGNFEVSSWGDGSFQSPSQWEWQELHPSHAVAFCIQRSFKHMTWTCGRCCADFLCIECMASFHGICHIRVVIRSLLQLNIETCFDWQLKWSWLYRFTLLSTSFWISDVCMQNLCFFPGSIFWLPPWSFCICYLSKKEAETGETKYRAMLLY